MKARTISARLAEVRELDKKRTRGPWRWNVNLKCKVIELEGSPRGYRETVMSFQRWGMRGGQPAFNDGNGMLVRAETLTEKVPGHEHHESWYRTLTHPDAQFIVALVNLWPELDALLGEEAMPAADAEEIARLRALVAPLLDTNCVCMGESLCSWHREELPGVVAAIRAALTPPAQEGT